MSPKFVNWKNYFFSVDFTPVHQYLSNIPLGTLEADNTATELANTLQTLDKKEGKLQWVGSGIGKSWNLVGAEVVYNGPNNNSLPTNSKYGQVLVLQFPQGSEAPVGRVYLQYNLGE